MMASGSVLMGKEGEVVMSETRLKRKVEFIESYWTGGEHGSDYEWNDNHGELIRCKDCKYGAWTHIFQDIVCRKREDVCKSPDWFCADGERKGGVHE